MATIDADTAVEAATSKDTFDVLEFVQGVNLPTNDVTVYTDADAALKMARILIAEQEREERIKQEGASLADDDELADEDEITELHERLVASRLVFHMRGIAPKAVKALDNKLKATHPYIEGGNNPEYVTAFNNTLIAKSIVSVENAAGAVNTDKWTPEKVADLLDSLYISESNKVFDGAAELTYVGAIFDRAVSADFS